MSLERFTINFDEFIKYYTKKWKIVLIVIVLFTALFTGTTKIFGNEIVVPHSERYLYYEERLKWHEDYFENSVLMSLNPTEIHVTTALVSNMSNQAELENYVISEEIWEDFTTETDKKYLPELVEWKETAENGVIEISLRHGTQEESEEFLKYLLEKINQKDSEVEITIGAERIEVDEELQDLQNDWYNRIDYLNDRMEEAEAGFTIHINIVAAAITGIIVGGLMSIIIVLLIFMISRNPE